MTGRTGNGPDMGGGDETGLIAMAGQPPVIGRLVDHGQRIAEAEAKLIVISSIKRGDRQHWKRRRRREGARRDRTMPARQSARCSGA